MTFRGVYKNGVVILEDATGLRNGETVDVQRSKSSAVKAKKSATAKRVGKMSAKPSIKGTRKPLPGFGAWKDRWPADMSSVEVVAEMRREAARRRRGR